MAAGKDSGNGYEPIKDEGEADACGKERIRCSYSYNPCPSCGVTTSLFGSFEIKRRGSTNWCGARQGVAVGLGDTIRICKKGQDEGKARIVFYNSGIAMDMKTGSELKFEKLDLKATPNSPRHITLTGTRGAVHFTVENATEPVELQCGSVTISSRQGEFVFECNDRELVLSVIDGKFQFCGEEAMVCAEVSAGQYCSVVSPGGKLVGPKPLDLNSVELWWEGLNSSYPME